MNVEERDAAIAELTEARNLALNVRDIFRNESAHWGDRQNYDARMHQIGGILRHIGYLIEYVENTKTTE